MLFPSWPVDTPIADMRARVQRRAVERRRRRRSGYAGLALGVTAVLLGVTQLGPSDVAKVQTRPADRSGADITGDRAAPGGAAPEVQAGGDGDGRTARVDGRAPTGKGPKADVPPVTVPPLPGSSTTTTTARSPEPGAGDIVFVRERRLWLVRPDGTGAGPLTEASQWVDHPDWSPDGRRLVAVLLREDVTGSAVGRLVVVELDGTIRPITGEARYAHPRWSPDGSLIVFMRNAAPAWTAPRPELWTVAPDGSGERRIAENSDLQASWSPDGSRLLTGCPGGLCTMKPDGSDVRMIPDTMNHQGAVWSPDGTRLVASALLDEGERIVTMKLDGSDRRTVADDFTTQLDWSPDGGELVASLSESHPGSCNCSRLWRIAADGSSRAALTDGDGHHHWPAWRPQ